MGLTTSVVCLAVGRVQALGTSPLRDTEGVACEAGAPARSLILHRHRPVTLGTGSVALREPSLLWRPVSSASFREGKKEDGGKG